MQFEMLKVLLLLVSRFDRKGRIVIDREDTMKLFADFPNEWSNRKISAAVISVVVE